MKACNKCGLIKAVDEFFKDSSTKDKKCARCKECMMKSQAKYREKNKEKVAIRQAKYRENKHENILASKAKYRAENKEKIAIYAAKYRSENRVMLAAKNMKYQTKAVKTLNDCYVKRKLKLKGLEIPKLLIELKRIQLLIKRELRQ